MNVTRVSRAPEAYAITEARTVRVSPTWKGSRRSNGECISIMPDGTTKVMTTTRKRESGKRTKVLTVVESRTAFNARMRALANTHDTQR